MEYYYYVKDHLGSVKMTLDDEVNIAGYDDYYPFGMVMPGRSMNNSNPNSIYKFTGKERDEETHYDYFGARYYDSRIGRWLAVDPLASARPGLSPYNYVQNNPLVRIDPTGMLDDVYINGKDADNATQQLDNSSNLNVSRDKKTGKLSATGEAVTDADKKLLAAINDPDVEVNLNLASGIVKSPVDGSSFLLAPGAYDGNKLDPTTGKTITSQFLDPKLAAGIETVGGDSYGQTVLHEVLESYAGATGPSQYRGAYSDSKYDYAHGEAQKLAPTGAVQIKHAVNNFIRRVTHTINLNTGKTIKY